MKFSDIQIPDKTLWQQYQEAYESGDYTTTVNLLKTAQLSKKALTAEMLNALTDYIVYVEGLNDPSFGADKIQVSKSPPAGLTSGQVYFRWLAPYLFSEVDARGYTFNNVDNLNLTWAQAEEGGW